MHSVDHHLLGANHVSSILLDKYKNEYIFVQWLHSKCAEAREATLHLGMQIIKNMEGSGNGYFAVVVHSITMEDKAGKKVSKWTIYYLEYQWLNFNLF